MRKMFFSDSFPVILYNNSSTQIILRGRYLNKATCIGMLNGVFDYI